MPMVLGYIRCSTVEQIDGASLDQQRMAVEGFAMMSGATGFNVQIFEDAGVSGSIPLNERPAGAELLAAAKRHDIIVASKLDRMFRNSYDALAIYNDFKKRGIHLVLLDLGNDPVTADSGLSKVIFTILSAFADHERERIRERVLEGKKAKLAKGGHIGGEAPYGWRIVGSGREAYLEEDPEEQEVIRKVVQWRAEMVARGVFASRLRLGILRNLHRSGHRTRSGSRFVATQVQRILDKHAVH